MDSAPALPASAATPTGAGISNLLQSIKLGGGGKKRSKKRKKKGGVSGIIVTYGHAYDVDVCVCLFVCVYFLGRHRCTRGSSRANKTERDRIHERPI